MNRKVLLVLSVLLLISSISLADDTPYTQGRVLVRFASSGYGLDSATASQRASARQNLLNQAGGGSVIRLYDGLQGWCLVNLPQSMCVESAIQAYVSTAGIVSAEPDYKIKRASVLPNDTRFTELWGLLNTGQAGGKVGADIKATQAWEYSEGSKDIIVAVTDSGVDYTHPDLAANMWVNLAELNGIAGYDDDGNGYVDDIYGYDFVGASANNPSPNSDPMDFDGHGTHVAGTIGAVGNNARGVVGVNWNVSIMALKMLDDNGDGSIDAAIEAINYAINNGAHVINASWGTVVGGTPLPEALYEAVARAQSFGILFVASAMNENNNNDVSPFWPANFDLDNIITVMATGNTDQRAVYSNYGAVSVDIAAPGGDSLRGGNLGAILSTLPGNRYGFLEGTSMAAPHVSGACALILSIDHSLNYTEVKQAIIDTADKFPQLTDLCTANGRLNLLAAIEEIALDNEPPTPNPAQWESWGRPAATGRYSIAMQAVQAKDNKGSVQYKFECTTHTAFSSAWQNEPFYHAQGLNPDTTYTFRVRARDDSNNMTIWSGSAPAKTAAAVDNLPPFPNPTQWKISPRRYGTTGVAMAAMTAMDENGPVRYEFEAFIDTPNNPAAGLNRGYDTDPNYLIPFGLTQGKTYYFRVRAKDALNNVTEWSTKAMVSLTAPPKTIEVPFDQPTIQDAIAVAQNGDTIVIHPGRYPAKGYNQSSANIDWFRGFKVDKNITIRSINPDDPQIVASTIIDCMDNVEMSGGFLLVGDTTAPGGGYCELRGLTITNVYIRGGIMSTPILPGMDGYSSGIPMFGGAVAIDGNHLVENCLIRDSVLIAWYGGDGSDGNDDSPYIPIFGGNGGRGADVGGAGIYVASGSPVIRGTIIQDCYVFAGNGGRGGDGTDAPPEITDPNNPGGRGGDGGNAGSAFGGGVFVGSEAISPVFEDCIIRNCFAIGGTAGDGGEGGDFANSSIQSPITGLPGDGSGGHGGVPGPVLGGGIYCGSETILRNCTVERNYALGGYGGNGGNAGAPSPTVGENFPGGVGGLLDLFDTYLTESTPQGKNNPDNFTAKGGGIYIAPQVSVYFESSSITSNFARGSVSGLGGINSFPQLPMPPRQNYQIESHGAGIAAGSNVTAEIRKSKISQNQTINSLVSASFREFPEGVDVYPMGVNPSERFEHFMIDYFGWGGGLYSEDSLNIQIIDCTIARNESPVGGGMAIADIDNINIIGSIISGNTAKYGGGIVNINSVLDINDCIISSNMASTSTGGGIHCTSSSLDIRNSILDDNAAAISGGGIFIHGAESSTAEQKITNCLIKGNQAFKSGAGIASRDEAFVTVKNCTVVENTVLNNVSGSGGGISCATNNPDSISSVEVVSSIFWDNAAKYGAQIAVGDPLSQNNPDATVWTRYSDSQGGGSAVFEGITQDPNGGPWSYWATGNINLDPLFVRASAQDPFSAYYLSHIASGQIANSPCINAGKDNALDFFVEIGMEATTRTDGAADSDRVDMGYHYPIHEEIKMYGLTIEVEVEPGFESDGMLQARLYGDNAFVKQTRNDPCSFYVPQGAIIELTAIPDADFKVDVWTGADRVPAAGDPCNVVTMDSTKKVTVSFTPDGFYYLTTKVTTDNGHIEYFDQTLGKMVVHEGRSIHSEGEVVELLAVPDNKSHVTHWMGTNDDLTISRENTITMNGRKDISVSFSPPRILYVGADSEYPTIQLAINAAVSGDIVMITPGTYDIYEASQDEPYLFVSGKDITITSVEPLDANNVTIVGGFVIENVRREMVIEGLTIQAHYSGGKRIGGPVKLRTPQGTGVDGGRGDWGYGGGMWLVNGYMSEYNFVWPDDELSIKSNVTASPTIRNCIFRDCIVRGVHGADGAAGNDGLGWGGNGGPGGAAYGGAVCIGDNTSPLFENCSFINNMAIGGDGGNGGAGQQGGPPGHGGSWGDKNGVWWWEYQVTDYWKYSGFGGAVYCGVNSSPEFINCLFENNNVYGGSSGISGTTDGMFISGWPYSHYKIDRFGGAVYAADNSTAIFRNCTFIGNEADVDGPELWVNTAPTVSAYDTLSYGGAIAFERSADLTFENTVFLNNTATVGGAVFYNESSPYIFKSDFIGNSALHGGGLLGVGGSGVIERCLFTENQATINGAQGGAIASLGGNTEIIDTQIIGNISQTSGGGVYISNKDITGDEVSGWNKVLLHNCLIAENIAGVTGGGISANWHAYPEIENCTIANNTIAGAGGYGGGLYSSYGNYATVNNSIIWGNSAGTTGSGHQIAIRPASRPAAVVVSYSDIQGGMVAVQPPSFGGNVWKDNGCIFEGNPSSSNIGANPADDPLFVSNMNGDYYLSQISSGQPQNSPCVDRGQAAASATILASGVGLDKYTTRTDEVFDRGRVDMGFHYPLTSIGALCKVCDLAYDGKIDFADFAKFASVWLHQDCSETNNWCSGADFNYDESVDTKDITLMAECWQVRDDQPPMPNPMQWEIQPYSTSAEAPYKISMKAVGAIDAWGWPIEYLFECTTDPNFDSGWISDRQYTAIGLQADTGYVFRVKARDALNNQTRFSVEAGAVTGTESFADDETPPTPNPMTFSQLPYTLSDTEIGMVASLAADESGVEYGFWNTTTGQIIWQDSREFISTGLTPSTTYTFRVAARDRSFNRNMTAWSDPASATTAVGGEVADREPPITNVYPNIYKAAFAVLPAEFTGADGYYHTMTAVTATDQTEPVLYRFICKDAAGFNSGWQINPTYTVKVSSASSKSWYMWRVETRDSVTPIPNYGTSSDFFNPRGQTISYP